ncbi:MAG: CPBP family intramembrane metalloprotease [Acidobacteria bacterium]|nr:CPBP family intramembrane metalloprotease [Acidobacteriota bacterium]
MENDKTLIKYCPACGGQVDTAISDNCPACHASPIPANVEQTETKTRLWGPGTGLVVWFSSVALIFGFQMVAIFFYLAFKFSQTRTLPKTLEIDSLLAGLSIGSTFPAHLMTLFICWFVVTDRGRRPFLKTLGWGWHSQFKWVHAVALAFLLTGVTILFEKRLPHKETDLEKLLKMGAMVRYLIAFLAVVTAPMVEEVVYRGILYTGIEKAWGKYAGIGFVTLLFALVHVPQYWGSVAAITAIITLSLVLTILRSWSGSLLPCVATHLVYNGIQAIALLFAPDKMPVSPTQSALFIWSSFF